MCESILIFKMHKKIGNMFEKKTLKILWTDDDDDDAAAADDDNVDDDD